MAGLYDRAISNEQLLKQSALRHRRFNLNYDEYIASFPYPDVHLLKSVSWSSIDFTRPSVATLNPVQGVYMFTFNPYAFSMFHHNAEFILYVGQAEDLQDRLGGYFNYINSKKAADQEKRFMVLYFGKFLKLQFYETGSLSQADLDTLEYSLIDSILPPFNLRFKSQFAQGYRRLITV